MAQHHMTCAVCGDYAGHFEQWWNRDTGYGLCARCRDWLTTPDPKANGRIRCDAAEMRDLYGEEGKHYAARTEAPANTLPASSRLALGDAP